MLSGRLRPRVAAVLVTAAVVATTVPGLRPDSLAAPGDGGVPAAGSTTPQDRYALANGCWAVQSAATGRWVARSGSGFAATAGDPGSAEPFHLQATDLGSYLLYDARRHFVSGDQLGLGAVVATAQPSERADFVVDAAGPGAFTLRLPSGKALATGPGGTLRLAPADTAGAAGRFAFHRVPGCAVWPEVQVNVSGEPKRGSSPYAEVAGYLDPHLHTMAFEFVGGQARCGRPWHPYGVTYALVDCPDHGPGGRGAALEYVLSGGDPVTGHDTTGWPTFGYWPRYNSLTHEQVYHKWLERSWRGGLRLMTTLLVENGALCKTYPLKKNSCNEMDAVRLQAQRMRELERYIDAQSGGPGEGWLRIVTEPEQARRVINEGKLAVILGIEISQLFNCNVVLGVPTCTQQDIDRQLDEVYALGVRQMELNNKFDNGLAGVTGDTGQTGVVVNGANKMETGSSWRMRTCQPAEHDHDHAGGHGGLGHDHGADRRQLNPFDDLAGESAQKVPQRDGIFGGVLQVLGASGVAPVYPEGPHCNEMGLSDLGRYAIQGMMQRGMIFDPDHMSASARHEALDLMQEAGYSGIVSSHSWSDETVYPRVLELGGVVTPYAGGSEGFVSAWRQTRAWAVRTGQYWGIGFGSDTNGFGAQGGPRGADAASPVTYPFTGFGGVTVDRQVSGERIFDVNRDGVAHYGLYPDWVEDLRRLAGDEIVRDLERGPEAYLQMWERATGVPGRRCHDPAELRGGQGLGALRAGMTPDQVLRVAGQPAGRDGQEFRWCVAGGQTVTARFDEQGRLAGLTGAGAVLAGAPAGADGAVMTADATGTGLPPAPAGSPVGTRDAPYALTAASSVPGLARRALPGTGGSETLALVGVVALAVGLVLRRRTRRRTG